MNVIPILLLALSITAGVLVTRVNSNENTACSEKQYKANELVDPFTETHAAETLTINKTIIL